MSEFSFELVYEFISRPICDTQLPPEDVPPMMSMLYVEDGKIARISHIPDEIVLRFFTGSNGKALLGQAIRETMSLISSGDKFGLTACLVLITEAYFKEVEASKKETIDQLMKTSLVDDPQARECMMVSIYRPELVRMGALPINADRTVSYRELFPMDGKFAGRLSLTPKEEDLPDGAKFH